MRFILILLSLSIALSSVANASNTVDDLQTISLNLDVQATEIHLVHYPNYRMGGGNGPSRKIRDCLLLDIRHSDAVVTLQQKKHLAESLEVLLGSTLLEGSGGKKLSPEVKGSNVVFYIDTPNLYMTALQIQSRKGQPLSEVLSSHLQPVRPGNSEAVPTGLVYVRDCRF